MRAILGRGGAGSLLLLACFCLLQANDSVAWPVALAAPTVQALSTVALPMVLNTSTQREFFISRRQVIPFNRQVVSVPILMYHYVQNIAAYPDHLGWNLSVSPAAFQDQMGWLAANGYHPIDFDDVRAYFGGVRPLPARPVIITLDDGYQDLYTTAFPILRARHFKAVAYIVSSFVGQSRYVSAAQVQEMDRDGIQIASHTVSHANLQRSSVGSVMHELVDSRAWLEHLVGHPVVDFAYPSGQFSAQVAGAVHLAGYDTGVTEQQSSPHSLADRYTWGRVRVGGGELLPDFIRSLGPVERSVAVTEVDYEPTNVQLQALPRPFPLVLVK